MGFTKEKSLKNKMASLNQKCKEDILYKEQHSLRADDGTVCEKVITIYKPERSPMKTLLIDITDCNNPFTLLVMKISHEDFNALKVKQGLTLDFSLFPDKLVYLLEQTKTETSRKYLHFENERSNGIQLSIREEGTIKHVTHLSLKFQCGSELEIKEKVLSYIRKIQKSQEDKENMNSELNMTLSSLKVELHKKDNVIFELENKCKLQCKELEEKISSQATVIATNKQQIAGDKAKIDQLRTSITANAEEIQRMKESIRDLEEEKNVFKRENDILKARLMDTTNKYESINNEHKQLERDLNIVKVRLKMSTDDANKKTSENEALHKKIDEMKRILNNKQFTENSLNSQLNEASKKIRLLSDQNSQYSIDMRSLSFELKELQEKYKFNFSDLNKANEIISRLQGELRTLKSVKAEIQNRLSESTNNIIDLKDEIKKKESKLNELRKKISIQEEDIEKKDILFQNLNIEKTNLQKALTSAYRELAELKQGGQYPFSISGKNLDSYYFKRFIQGSKVPDVPKVPLSKDIPQNEEPIIRDSEKEKENASIGKITSVLQNKSVNKGTSSFKTLNQGKK